ncbi:MAG: hypothetical protein WAQ27_01185 [Candidatus Microsaccharimonas sp.]
MKSKIRGFTLVEMVVIAPIVILAIGSFITVIVAMTGDVLSSRGSNVLAYDVQDALNRMEEDVKLSSGFLAKNNIPFSASNPQGYGVVGSTTNFTSVQGTSGTSLILSAVATDGNPLATTSRMVYLANEPNSCDSYAEYSKNKPMLTNIIYFVDTNGTLWRRTVMPYGYDNSALRCGNAAWQQPSCQTGYVSAFCKTNDVRLVSGVGSDGLTINYYPSANSTVASTTAIDPVEATRTTALKSMQTASITISATDSIAGRDISRSGTVRVTRLDTNATAIADSVVVTAPAAPVISSTVSDGSTVNFSWPRVPTATSYLLEYKINSGSWIAASATLNSNERSYSLLANHEDTVSVQVKAVNSAGQSGYGTGSLSIPFWSPLVLSGDWTQYGGTAYASAEFSRTSTGLVVLKGLVKKSTTAANGDIIATLPPGYRPTGRLVFGTATNPNATGRVDIDTDGNVILVAGDAGYFSLDTVRFIADSTGMSNVPTYTRNSLTYSNSWTNYGGVYANASYVVDNKGRVVTQGLASSGTTTAGTLITAIPAGSRPAKYQILPSRSTGYSQIGIDATSGIVARDNNAGFHSLNAIWFPASPSPALTWTTMTLQSSWVSYDGGTTHELPQYSKTGTENMVTLKGLIKSGTSTDDTVVATLPVGYRPEGRLMFATTNSGAFTRVDIKANGEITLKGSGIGNTWQSLSGITFHADQ